MRRKRIHASTAAALITLAIAGDANLPSLFGSIGREPTDEEKKFLASLKGEARRIWQRRIAGGLSESEREFVRKRLEEL